MIIRREGLDLVIEITLIDNTGVGVAAGVTVTASIQRMTGSYLYWIPSPTNTFTGVPEGTLIALTHQNNGLWSYTLIGGSQLVEVGYRVHLSVTGNPVVNRDYTISHVIQALTLTAVEVKAQVAQALVDIHLDHLLAVTYDPASKPGVADALLNELIGNDGGVSQFTANALELGPLTDVSALALQVDLLALIATIGIPDLATIALDIAQNLTAIQSVQNNTTFVSIPPAIVLIPETGNNIIAITCTIQDTQGSPEAPDIEEAVPLVAILARAINAGVDKTAWFDDEAGTTPATLSATYGGNYVRMTAVTTGQYIVYYKLPDTEVVDNWKFTFKYKENAVQFIKERHWQVAVVSPDEVFLADSDLNKKVIVNAIRENIPGATVVPEVGSIEDDLLTEINENEIKIDALNDISTTDVKNQVDQALIDINLDHLLFTSVTGADVSDDSVIARMVSKAATADWDTFINTTDSLEAIRDALGALATPAGIADEVWNRILPGNHDTVDSSGWFVQRILEDTGTTIPTQIASLNNISQLQVYNQVAAALAAIQLDHLMALPCDANDINNHVVDQSVIAKMLAIGGDISDFNSNLHSLEALSLLAFPPIAVDLSQNSKDFISAIVIERTVTGRHTNGKPSDYIAGLAPDQWTVITTQNGNGETNTEHITGTFP